MTKISINLDFKKLIFPLFVILLLFLVSCSPSVTSTITTTVTSTKMETITNATASSTTTKITPTMVSPTPAHPNTGGIYGRVFFTDNTPANSTSVAAFKSGEYITHNLVSTNANGEYHFTDLPVGSYEIQPLLTWASAGVETPVVKISVSDQQISTAPPLSVPRYIDTIYCNGSEIIMFKFNAPLAPLTLSWRNIPNSNTYTVTITGNPNDTPPGPADYDKSTTTTMTSIIWPTLQVGGYEIVIKAFNQQNTLIGIGMEWFEVQ